ncbi:VCBS domain-containing protein [Vibrio fluvialis]|uniref:VCBS domain-containing protein n=1 Tax=Vibrio fluvialis TaxID=676 RepID=UPI001EECB0A7|nr:VCBS domain-containing protein [Vibrio fluvialis]
MSSGILSANQIIVIDTNGNIRTATIGEKLPHGTVIVQRGDNITDDAELKAQLVDANNTPQDITDDVARIFAALEEGQDPTQVDDAEAPAAGGAQGSALAEAATIERIGSETIATTDFDTTGFESLGLSQTQSLALSSLLVDSTIGAADDSAITVGSGDSAAESVTEDENVTDGNLTTSGSLTVTDADGDGAFNTTPTFTSSTVEGGAQLGTLTIDAEGNWTYTVDNNNATVQGLNAGETIVETYTVATEDGKDTQTITITINGAADDSAITVGSSEMIHQPVTTASRVNIMRTTSGLVVWVTWIRLQMLWLLSLKINRT